MNRLVIALVFVCLLLFSPGVDAARKGRKMQKISEATWGAPHMVMQVENGSATIEYDCAHGTIDGPLRLDSNGKFSLTGTHFREHGGPIRENEKQTGQPAKYTGSTDGKKLNITVKLTENNETLGTFRLTKGQSGRLWKCK